MFNEKYQSSLLKHYEQVCGADYEPLTDLLLSDIQNAGKRVAKGEWVELFYRDSSFFNKADLGPEKWVGVLVLFQFKAKIIENLEFPDGNQDNWSKTAAITGFRTLPKFNEFCENRELQALGSGKKLNHH
jgi:hypothetical protein